MLIVTDPNEIEAALIDTQVEPRPVQQPVSWFAMTEPQRKLTLKAMEYFGNSFAMRASALWQCADTLQSLALERAFPDLLKQYGPGTDAYADAQRFERGLA